MDDYPCIECGQQSGWCKDCDQKRVRQESVPDMPERVVYRRDMSWAEEDEEMFPIILTNLIFCLIIVYYFQI